MIESSLAQKIRQKYEENFNHPFPLDDLLKLKRLDPFNWNRLHGELDLYFSTVAGYAYRADRLWRSSKKKLLEAKFCLAQSFFEKHPSLSIYENAITKELTPNLFARLVTVQ